jgi:O-6-methylguanine DNA methyltransferase
MMDPVIEGLQAMRTTAPPSLLPRVLAATGLADGYVRVPGPLGELFVAFSPDGVSWIAPAGDAAGFEAAFRHHVGRDIVPVPMFPPKWQRALDRALETGRLGALPVDLRSVSPFQAEVLRAITAIPPGEVRPYAWVARQVGRPGAVRAVGTAMAKNPVPVVVPCHRVIRSDGTVGNYAYGPEMKRALLTAEGLDVAEMEAEAVAGHRLTGSDTTHIYCYPSCHHARRVTDNHRVWFHDAAEATAAGYRPCKRCLPLEVAA